MMDDMEFGKKNKTEEIYISQKDVLDLLNNCLWGKSRREAIDDLLRIPPSDVAPIVHGEWLYVHDGIRCNQCGERIINIMHWGRLNFCPDCGAKMK